MKATIATLMALATGSLLACGSYDDNRLTRLATEAISDDPILANKARGALRAQGQAGLDALFTVHRSVLEGMGVEGAASPQAQAVRAALADVGRQHDCHVSRLFWHTDLSEAKALARKTGKPILSLRLLGQLDEDLSCANSRFFRTTLYANSDLSSFLREQFVLHWQSVRPAPRITIDFGDGRKMERTITGNSIHYVLDAEGNLLDGLPGLYSAKAFRAGLERALDLAGQLARAPEPAALLRRYHEERLAAIATEWAGDLANLGVALPATAEASNEATLRRLRDVSTEEVWRGLAQLRSAEAVLDAASRRLIAQKNAHPNAIQAGKIAISKAIVEDPLLRLVRRLERSIAEDTVRNEYLLHTQIHQWLAQDSPAQRVETLNARVYAELFLTPHTDPWLGLADSDMFSGLDNNGLMMTARP